MHANIHYASYAFNFFWGLTSYSQPVLPPNHELFFLLPVMTHTPDHICTHCSIISRQSMCGLATIGEGDWTKS